jgi:hypothetical protein
VEKKIRQQSREPESKTKRNWFKNFTHRTSDSFVFHRLIDEAIETEFGCDAG